MGQSGDLLNATRRTIKPPIHRAFSWAFGGYAMSSNTEDEYVGTVEMSCEELAAVLSELGFSRSVFSALKIRVDGNVSDGSYVWRKWVLGDGQLHVMFHEVDGHVEVYAHWERSWIRHPIGHVKKEGLSTERGVETTRKLLSECRTDEYPDGLPLEVESLFWRPPWYFGLVENVSEDWARWLAGLNRHVRNWRRKRGEV
ncbi:hypothetical protein [Natronorarus salvus]|uniref:hypothetical protein n=1 Tax=Natronorarus salvus TaxID=3117733 RepID=UPI002F2651C2